MRLMRLTIRGVIPNVDKSSVCIWFNLCDESGQTRIPDSARASSTSGPLYAMQLSEIRTTFTMQPLTLCFHLSSGSKISVSQARKIGQSVYPCAWESAATFSSGISVRAGFREYVFLWVKIRGLRKDGWAAIYWTRALRFPVPGTGKSTCGWVYKFGTS
jgi:hypothetical protein